MLYSNKMLVVDDHEVTRDILKEIFIDDYDIIEAENGEVAINLIEKYSNSIGIILLDLMMPVMDGFDVIKYLQRSKLITKIPVVVITAENNEANETRILEMGASDIIGIPFVANVVRRRVANVVSANNYKNNLERISDILSKKLQKSNETMIDTLSSIIEHRSLESGQHIKRIRKFTEIVMCEIARSNKSYNIDNEMIQIITSASTLHDIGKIVIPDAILNKPGKLLPEEFDIMKTHTVEGGKIIKQFDPSFNKVYLDYAYQIACYHHERWDGKGYPEKLEKARIPLCAQVVGIADVYDALTTPRVYKGAYDHNKAITMILTDQCGMFSPEMKQALRNVADKFEKLANAYKDGSVVIDEQPVINSESHKNASIDEAFRLNYFKYVTLQKVMNADIFDLDFDKKQYQLFPKKNSIFSNFSKRDALNKDFFVNLSKYVHPDDVKSLSSRLLEDEINIEAGRFKERSTTARVMTKNNKYELFEVLQVYVDVQSVSQHKTLLIFKNINEKIGSKDINIIQGKPMSPDYNPMLETSLEFYNRFKAAELTPEAYFSLLLKPEGIAFIININSGKIQFENIPKNIDIQTPNVLHDFFIPELIKIHPDDKDHFFAMLESLVRGIRVDGALTFRCMDRNGNYIRFCRKASRCIYDNDNNVTHLIGLLNCLDS